MLDSKTISATLLLGLLGCASSTPGADTQPTADAATDLPATSDPATTAVASAEVKAPASQSPATSSLPMGRTEPLPPMDKKPVAAGQSKRTGAEACCGEGTCGDCKPLPGNRAAPKPPKDGKSMPASMSKRAGKEACCGEGTCGPC